MSAFNELHCRQLAATFIQEMGHKLKLSQLAISTAIVYMHRFYVFHSFSKFQRNDLAAAALFLAAKVEQIPRQLDHVVRLSFAIQHQHQLDDNQLDADSNHYLDEVQNIGIFENVLLQTLGFDLQVYHPHPNVIKCCQIIKAPKIVAHASYWLATDSLHLTTFCLRFRPTVVACVCIYVACKWVTWEIPVSREDKQWFTYVDKDMTIELLQQLSDEFIRIMETPPNEPKLKKVICEQAAKLTAAARASGASNSGDFGQCSKFADVQQPGSQIPGSLSQKRQKLLSRKEIIAQVKAESENPVSQASIPSPSGDVPVVSKVSARPPVHLRQSTSASVPLMIVNDFTGNSKWTPLQQLGIPLQTGVFAKPSSASANHRSGGGCQARPGQPLHHDQQKEHRRQPLRQHDISSIGNSGKHHVGSVKGPPPSHHQSKHAGEVPRPSNEGPAARVQPLRNRHYASSAAVSVPSRDKFVPPPPPRAIRPRTVACIPTSDNWNFISPPSALSNDIATTPQQPLRRSNSERLRDNDRPDRLEQRIGRPSTTGCRSTSRTLVSDVADRCWNDR